MFLSKDTCINILVCYYSIRYIFYHYDCDLQDEYTDALAKLHTTVSKAFRINPDIKFEVFIHKVDGLSDDHRIETQRDIHQRANDNLADDGLENIHLR